MRPAHLLVPLLSLVFLGEANSAESVPDVCVVWAESLGGERVFWIDGANPAARDDGPGTTTAPWKTTAAASRRDLRRGDVVVLRPGTYRGALRPLGGGLTITGCPDAETIVTGSAALRTTWTQDGKDWIADRYRPMPNYGDRYDPNLILLDGEPMRPAPDRDSLSVGAFAVWEDAYKSERLVVRLPDGRVPSDFEIEAGVHAILFGPAGSEACRDQPDAYPGVTLQNLIFEHAANPAQMGAVCIAGTGAVVRDVLIRRTNGRGMEMWGTRHTVARVNTSDNGHLGIGGGCVDCLLEDVTADRNNWRGHDPYWEAGGGKWVRTTRTVFRNFAAADNDGPGLWLDGDSPNNLIDGATLSGNLVSGLQIELGSDNTRVVGSHITGTRRDGWAAEGILVMASSGTTLERNTLSGNEGSGLWLRMDSRRQTGGISATGNVFSGNAPVSEGKDYQVRLEIDALVGGARPEFLWRDNHLISTRAGHLAGIRPDRDAPVQAVRSASELHALLGVDGPTEWVLLPTSSGGR
ncbi:MAG: parallel beta-helix repeat protein [Rhodothermales bacterium]|jgi:parallel beta-helix repeat protein